MHLLLFPSPPLSTGFSHLLAVLFASSYVGCLYVSKGARLSFKNRIGRITLNGSVPREKLESERWRDDPDVIRARLAAVAIATIVCCSVVFGTVWAYVGVQPNSIEPALETTAFRLGFISWLDWESMRPHLVTPILFLGPLYCLWLEETFPLQRNWSIRQNLLPVVASWVGARNYFVAPVTEEIVFRACVLSVYQLSGASKARMIFLSPLSFGLAHLHHAWDIYNRFGKTEDAARRALVTSLVQLSYTTVFGFHCCFLFLRSGSILPAITAHIFCNIMSLPALGWELRRFPDYKKSILATYMIGVLGYVYAMLGWTLHPKSLYWRDNMNAPGAASY